MEQWRVKGMGKICPPGGGTHDEVKGDAARVPTSPRPTPVSAGWLSRPTKRQRLVEEEVDESKPADIETPPLAAVP